MSLADEKATDVGLSLTLDRPNDTRQKMETIEDVESINSITPTNSRCPESSPLPFSPFYDHSDAPTTLSLSDPSHPKANLAVYESDIEACLTESKSNILSQKKSTNKGCTVWPGQRALKEAKKAEKAEKRRGECWSWNPMRGLDKRTKFWAKVLIAAVIVGVAVAVGLGISKAVGGGIWKQ